jgi:hypothetical protein
MLEAHGLQSRTHCSQRVYLLNLLESETDLFLKSVGDCFCKNGPQCGFAHDSLTISLTEHSFGRNTTEVTLRSCQCSLSGGPPMFTCPILGEDNRDHFAKVVSARFLSCTVTLVPLN